MPDEFAWLERIAWATTIFTLVVAIVTVRAANIQRRRQFETIYVQRYWALIDQLSLDALRGDQQDPIDAADQRVARFYLRLCEDELELRQAGWITDETWRIWEAGIVAQLQRWPFDQVWQEVSRETGQDGLAERPEEFTLLRAFLADQKDPLTKVSRWTQGVRGFRRMITGGP